MTWILEAPVQRVEQYPGANFLLQARAPEIARASTPGQFVMAAPAQPHRHYPSPLLKRALAVYSADPQSGSLGLLVKAVGDGTRSLARLRPGDRLDLVGPLGNGFDWTGGGEHLIVAGGIGIASVLLLARELSRARKRTALIYGARTAADLVGLEDFQRLGLEIVTTTEDGSHGLQGRVTDGLQQLWTRISPASSRLYVCGPTPMMKAVSELADRRGAACQISVEVKMACGFGVCLGCSVKTLDGFRLACTHGPVFDSSRFVWEPREAVPTGRKA